MINVNSDLTQLKKGNMQVFDNFYNKTNKSIFLTALSVLKNRALAEEVMQDSYIKILENISSYNEKQNGYNWIITITKNTALNVYNKSKKENAVDSEILNNVVSDKNMFQEYFLLDLASKHLSQIEFQILTFCEIKGYKRREVSKMLDIPLSTVSFHYSNALKKLKSILEKDDQNEK